MFEFFFPCFSKGTENKKTDEHIVVVQNRPQLCKSRVAKCIYLTAHLVNETMSITWTPEHEVPLEADPDQSNGTGGVSWLTNQFTN